MSESSWQKIAPNYYEQWLKDLKTLVKIPSVKSTQTSDKSHPYGVAVKQSLDQMLSFAARDGLRFGCVADRVGYIEYGPVAASETVGILVHVDVVPVGDGWTSSPFEPEQQGHFLTGRGVDDMKASTMLSYYAIKLIADQQLAVKNKIRLIIGTDEENDWSDMPYYFQTEGVPDIGFSPDGEFIVENAEAGIANFMVSFSDTTQGQDNLTLLKFDAGVADNVVPGLAVATITGIDETIVTEKLDYFLKQNADVGLKATVQTLSNGLEIKMIGKQAHGSTPDVGLNAGTYLANFLTQLDFTGEAASFLQILGHTAHLDYFGKKMGLAFNQAEMGPLVVNYGLQKFVSGEDGYFSINIRYPIGITEKQMLAIIQRSVKTLHSSVTVKKDELLPHLTPKNDAVIETLLASYETVMGQPTVLHYSTGASYGRLIKRGAAFGTRFAWQTTTAHQANEKYDLENYPKAMAILVESIYRLGNIE